MKRHTYHVHFNKGRPFQVACNGARLDVYVSVHQNWFTADKRRAGSYTVSYESEPVVSLSNHGKVYIGDDVNVEGSGGNTILVQLQKGKNSYLLIGGSKLLQIIALPEPINKYCSPMGPNDVPYPYIIGKKYVYDLGEMLAMRAQDYANREDKSHWPADLIRDPSIARSPFTCRDIPPGQRLVQNRDGFRLSDSRS